MPKLWNKTIETHRQEVREAILYTTWTLVVENGVRSATMSQIAKKVGIGRATLYKYFPDVDAILIEWHHRHIAAHLEHLTQLGNQHGDPTCRLEAVLSAYAMIIYHRGSHVPDLGALLHHKEHIAGVQQQVTDLIRDLLIEVAASGHLREDVPPAELASYCLHALTAAEGLDSEVAVRRLVAVTMAGIRWKSESDSSAEQ
ncbi:TetR/AcrR family transcriptional regulator [Corynebacterium sp. A21]|uniref:TetR/AcrR family transcriptional regulator n=1 Tax=Corynebacterium sp. A21 TaxID=3457318 RepID=UPI003FD12F82